MSLWFKTFRGMTTHLEPFYRRPMKKFLFAVLTIAFTFGATLAQGEGAADETRMTLRGEWVRAESALQTHSDY